VRTSRSFAARTWFAGVASAGALGYLTWWLIVGGTRGAEIAGDLSAAAALIAAAAAVWPLWRRPETHERQFNTNISPSPTSLHTTPQIGTLDENSASWHYVVPASRVAWRKEIDSHQPIRLTRHVALWGAPASGKTCFLTALNSAVAQAVPPWALVGSDKSSAAYLAECIINLIGRRMFPPATQVVSHFKWLLSTEISMIKGPPWRKKTRRSPLELNLEIFDAPGGAFWNNDRSLARRGSMFLLGLDEFEGSSEDAIVSNLSNSDGIVFFFDPLREHYRGDAFEYFQRVVTALEYRAKEEGRLDSQRLPHRLAVCVTKYDHPQVLDIARRGGYLTVAPGDQLMFPRVADDRAEEFFADLCKRSPTGGATLVHLAIRRHFHADRVRYFATSSVGFFVDHSKRFNADDCYNVIERSGEVWMLRGPINPINVLEPLLWLALPR
jgi:hypothetical protein